LGQGGLRRDLGGRRPFRNDPDGLKTYQLIGLANFFIPREIGFGVVESWTGDSIVGFKAGFGRSFDPADCKVIDNVTKRSDPDKIKTTETKREDGRFGSYSGSTN